MNLNGVEYYYIRNAQGDIIGLINNTGATVASYTYDFWGKFINADAIAGNAGSYYHIIYLLIVLIIL